MTHEQSVAWGRYQQALIAFRALSERLGGLSSDSDCAAFAESMRAVKSAREAFDSACSVRTSEKTP